MRSAIFLGCMVIANRIAHLATPPEPMPSSTITSIAIFLVVFGAMDTIEFFRNLTKGK